MHLLAAVAPQANTPDTFLSSTEESSFAPILAKLTDAQRASFLDYYRNKRAQQQPHNLALNALVQPVPVPPRRDDSIAISRHRKLMPGEQPVPVQTVRRENPDQVERGKLVFEALQRATSSHDAAIGVLRQLGPLPAPVR